MLLQNAGEQGVARLFSKYQDRLRQMVAVRLDQRLIGRVDPDDVLQEAYIEMARRKDDYLADPVVSFFVWARRITWQVLLTVHRRHFSQKRHPRQETALHGVYCNNTSSFAMVQQIVAKLASPSQVAMRAERATALMEAIDELGEFDREIVLLRHFENLTNTEAANVLGLSKTASSNRYTRALKRLRDRLVKHDARDTCRSTEA